MGPIWDDPSIGAARGKTDTQFRAWRHPAAAQRAGICVGTQLLRAIGQEKARARRAFAVKVGPAPEQAAAAAADQ
jgi:hypothetical protein